MNEELDSQLSAMFDDELPTAECELLARRLSRDEQLKSRWGRYAAIGATIRAEGGTRLSAELARRVCAVLSAEPALTLQAEPIQSAPLASRWRRPVAGAAVAASVAAAAIFFMRLQSGSDTGSLVAASGPLAQPIADARPVQVSSVPESYVVPRAREHRSIVPATQLANYVVAHSEFSSPVNRRNLLSALMANESGTAAAGAGSEESNEDVYDDAKNAP